MKAFIRSGPLRKAASNSAWLIMERGFILLTTLLVSIVVSRYLGPLALGKLDYAIAVVSLIGAVSYLGFGGVVVKDLVDEPETSKEILGTTFLLKLAASLVCVAIIVLISLRIGEGYEDSILLAIVAISLPFESLFVIRLLFESRVQSRSITIATTSATLIAAVARIGAAIASYPLWVFAALYSAQAAVTAGFLVLVYLRSEGSPFDWRWNKGRAKSLLSRTWPLMISSMGAILYLKIDQVMIGPISGMAEVGIYSVAARLSEVWYFLPSVLAGSIFPRLIQLKGLNQEAYVGRLRDALRYMFISGVAIAIPVSIFATPVVKFLYGEEFSGAGLILSIHIWACPAVFMGVVLSKWLVIENFLIFSITRHAIGATANILLNLILIPVWGGAGAAIATLASYTAATYLACFTSKRTFEMGKLMTDAIVFPIKWAFWSGWRR